MSGKPLLKRWWVRILIAFVVLGAVLYFARNLLVRKGLEAAVTEATGFPLAIDSFDLGLLDSRVEVKGMRLSNPPGFEDPRCVSVRRLAADVVLRSAFREVLRIQEIDLDLEEVVVVKNAKGETNLDRLSALGGDGGEKKPGEGTGETKAPAKERKWKCDRLHLRLPRVVHLDYTDMKNGKPKREVFDLKVDETFRNVRGPEEVVKILVMKVLANTPVKLLRASADSLAGGVGDALGGALEGILGGDGKKEPEPPKKKPARRK